MSEFEASIKASRLKHAVSVLHRVYDESIFKVCDNEIISRIVDASNAVMVEVIISYDGTDDITAPEAHQVGIDLDKMTSIIKRASAKEDISISEFAGDTWFFKRGIHQRSIRLLDPKKLRKLPDKLNLIHTAAIRLSGKEFKDIMAESGELGSNWIRFSAPFDATVRFQTESNDMTPDTYTATLPADRFESQPTGSEVITCLYTLEFLQDIAVDMRATDEVLVQFSTDMPCEIGYTRDGVEIGYVVAPRIESD